MKNITIIGVNYYPEDSAIGLYTTQKAEYLTQRGFNVSVITGFPYYPYWKINEDYIERDKYDVEKINGVRVYRYKQYVPQNPTFAKRIKHILSFTLGSLSNLNKVPKPSVVIAIVPFISTIFLGWLLKLRYKSKLWVHIQDFEFDAALESGLVNKNKSIIFKFLFFVERFLLKRADVLSTISKGMMDKLERKTKKKGFYLTNWLDTEVFDKQFNESHPYLSNTNAFKILYSGNIGAKQDWSAFFRLLDKLKGYEKIEVIVVGEGANRKFVEAKLKNYKFTQYYKPVPFSQLPQLLASADLHVLFQKDDVIDTVMPSKILGMMGSGNPSIVTGNLKSEVKEIFERASAGYYYENNQLNEIVQKVLNLKKNSELRNELGNSAKEYVNKFYSKESVMTSFINELEKVLS
jgi:colanic acid biosynthesis glycosyl transferase WcaI